MKNRTLEELDQSTESQLVNEALRLTELGLMVIPLLPRSKRPGHRWGQYQHEQPNAGELIATFGHSPSANLAIVTGTVSGILVVDIDGDEGKETFALAGGDTNTWCVETSHGLHYYYRHPGEKVGNSVKQVPGIDIRGDGGYVVAPPSVHPDGSRYVWRLAPWDIALADPDDWLLKLIRNDCGSASNTAGLCTIIEAGRRNDTLYRLARSLRQRGLSQAGTLSALVTENRTRCAPPLHDGEVKRIVENAYTQPNRPDFDRDLDFEASVAKEVLR